MVPQKQPNSVGHSATLNIPELNNPRRRCSIRSLLTTLGGAMNTPTASPSARLADLTAPAHDFYLLLLKARLVLVAKAPKYSDELRASLRVQSIIITNTASF
jgi:hypothetical protein